MKRAVALWAFIVAALYSMAVLPRVSYAQGATGATLRNSRTIATQLDWQQVGDTARFIGRWQRTCDAAGCADSVRLAWTLGGVVQPVRTLPTIVGARWVADTVRTLRAWCPAATTASLTITMLRRGRASATVTRTAAMGCRDAAPPPVDSFAIDTGFVWRGAVRVDSLPPRHADSVAGWYQVFRADASTAMVHPVHDAKQRLIGAQVRVATTCPDSMWWPTGDTTSVRVAQARASQWPIAALSARATAAFKAMDYRAFPVGQVWQARCG